MNLRVLPYRLAICRLPARAEAPGWALAAPVVSVTRTPDELSIVCLESSVPEEPEEIQQETGWRALQVEGPLDFSLTGVVASLASPLADAEIPIFVISTFDTDYLLVKAERLEAVVEVLQQDGHQVRVLGTGSDPAWQS